MRPDPEPIIVRGTVKVIGTRLLAYLAACLVIASAHPAQADDIDDLIESELTKRHVPGLSFVVLRDGQTLRAAGHGMANLELQVPASPDTVYEIGSISKQFAAEAILLLVEDGKLKLDDPINKFLPANAPESWQTITIEQLLRHTSGLKDWTEVKEFSYRRQYSPGEFIDLVRSFPLEFPPNQQWKYSNTNLPLIGIIISQASAQEYEEFVTERIFQRFQLPSIQFHRHEKVIRHRASGYVLRDGHLERGEPFRPGIIAASGGVLANVTDLAKWWEAVLNGRLLQPASQQALLKRTEYGEGRHVTHGLSIFCDRFNGHKSMHHHGSTAGGFGSVVRYFPEEKLTVAVMCNLEDGGWCADYVSKRIANAYIPGSFIGGLPAANDEGNQAAETHLKLLKAMAKNENPSLLANNYVPRVSDTMRQQMAKNLETLKSFEYLGTEQITSDHFVVDNRLTEVKYFKMVTGDRSQYYHFRYYPEGTIGFIVVED